MHVIECIWLSELCSTVSSCWYFFVFDIVFSDHPCVRFSISPFFVCSASVVVCVCVLRSVCPSFSYFWPFSLRAESQSLQFLCLLFQMDLLPYQAANEAALFILWFFEWRANHLTPASTPPRPPCIFRLHLISCWINTTSGHPRGPSHMSYQWTEQKEKT